MTTDQKHKDNDDIVKVMEIMRTLEFRKFRLMNRFLPVHTLNNSESLNNSLWTVEQWQDLHV